MEVARGGQKETRCNGKRESDVKNKEKAFVASFWRLTIVQLFSL